MEKPALIRFIEKRYGRKPPGGFVCGPSGPRQPKAGDGLSVVVVGGGIAGPAFARRVLASAMELGIRVQITLISRPSCNYCGGLVTNLSLQTMRGLYNYEPSPEVVLSQVEEVVLVNPRGSTSVVFESPLVSVFRTSRFGQLGLDDSFRQNILAGLPEAAGRMLTVVEPAVATSIELAAGGAPGAVTYAHTEGVERVEADLIVIATGLRSIESKFIGSLSEQSRYRPPRIMPACVTEIDLADAGSSIGRRMLILNGIVRGSMVALIPKQLNWITIAALKKVLTIEDLNQIFAHPAVRRYIQLDRVQPSLACRKVCASGVYTSPARDFYGDGWVVLGDLTGYGRVLKDGYFAALIGADLAAHTAIVHGCSSEAFARHYHRGLRQFEADNRAGMKLFGLNQLLARFEAYNRLILGALEDEGVRHPYGGLTHAAFRALSTGELSYTLIGLLFAAGLISSATMRLLHLSP